MFGSSNSVRQDPSWSRGLLASTACLALIFFDTDSWGLTGAAAALVDTLVVLIVAGLLLYVGRYVGTVLRDTDRE